MAISATRGKAVGPMRDERLDQHPRDQQAQRAADDAEHRGLAKQLRRRVAAARRRARRERRAHAGAPCHGRETGWQCSRMRPTGRGRPRRGASTASARIGRSPRRGATRRESACRRRASRGSRSRSRRPMAVRSSAACATVTSGLRRAITRRKPCARLRAPSDRSPANRAPRSRCRGRGTRSPVAARRRS